MNKFETAFNECGLVAILRGLTPENAQPIGMMLYQEGFKLIEVPLNSPNPFESIRILAESTPDDCLVGAGTVLNPDDVARVKEAGGDLIIMPHSDPEVLAEARRLNMIAMPGVCTPTEGFAAFKNGATAIKLFPGEMITPEILKAWRAVFDKSLKLLPVGGVNVNNMEAYKTQGASGFGLGGGLFKPDMSFEEVQKNARAYITRWKEITAE